MTKKKKQAPEVYMRDSYSFEPPKAVDVDEDAIQKAIDDIFEHLLNGSEYCFWATGRAFVLGFKDTGPFGDYRVIVVRDGYEQITFTKKK